MLSVGLKVLGSRAAGSRVLSVWLLVLAAASCATSDPMDRSMEGIPLADLAPIPYRIAVAPVEGLAAPTSDYAFALTEAELQRALVDRLVALRTATAVEAVTAAPRAASPGSGVAIEDAALRLATEGNFDLLVRPRIIEQPALAYEEVVAGRAVVSSAFWLLLNWLGEQFVETRRYHANMAVEFEVQSPHGVRPLTTLTARIDRQDLRYLERNDFWSVPTVAALFVPGFLIWDNETKAARSLSERAASALGTRLAKFLKEDLRSVERQRLGDIAFRSPEPGAVVDGSFRLLAEIMARARINRVEIFVDNVLWKAIASEDLGRQERIDEFVVALDEPIEVGAGESHVIAVEVVIGGQRASRTLQVQTRSQGK